MNYSYILYLPLTFFGVVIYKMCRDYIEVTYYEKCKKKLN